MLLFAPGGLVGAVSGLRGWTLAATAPLLGYALAGVGGPLFAALGIGWSAASAAIGLLVVLAIVGGARWLLRRRWPAPGPPEQTDRVWSRTADAAVAAAVAVAALVGVAAIVGGIRYLGAVPQDWDALFHANGIRYIADTGDGGLYGMATTNWYEDGVTVFYPNAYHLVATVVYDLTGASIPTVLNAHTVLIPGMLALSLAAMVRRYRARALLAAAAALAAVSVSSVYDLLWRGPLLPFATGVALTPVVVVLVRDLLDSSGMRSMVRAAGVFAVAVAGLLCLHPAILVGAVLFALPPLVQRWWQRPVALPREVGLLVAAGLVGVAACVLQVGGVLSSGSNLATISWPADLTVAESVGQVLTFSHAADSVQLGLTAVLALGLLAYRRLGDLRWVGFTAAIFGVLFVVAASVEKPWAKTLTSLWWNDRWRLVALTAVPLCVVIGHGVAEAQRCVVLAVDRLLGALPGDQQTPRTAGRPVALLSAAAALVALAVVTNTFYIARDQERMTTNSGTGPAVSPAEIAGMQAVARIVPPGERVLNDRGDGSAWMYALTGTRPVAGHYDAARIGPDAALLAQRFNAYPSDPAVQAAVQRLGIRYVQLDSGFLREWESRQPGLTGLDRQPWLTEVYRNPGVVLYEITPAPPPRPASLASPP